MPTRYLKHGICDSESMNALSSSAEVMFYRLLVNVDDFGRIDARPLVLKAKCFPIKEVVTPSAIGKMLAELVANGLVLAYEAKGNRYLQMLKWDNVPRAKESKCPPPPESAYDCMQVYADEKQSHTNLPVTVTVTGTKTETKTPPTEGAEAPTEETLFGRGLEVLTSRGVEKKNGRSFIGLMRKNLGDVKAMALLLMVDERDISNPMAWLTKAMDTRNGNDYKSRADALADTGNALTGRSAGDTRTFDGYAVQIN
jgi:hypothetical protein